MLVNFEDHLKFVVLPGKEPSLVDGLSLLLKSLHTFEQLAYATDQSIGNLTVHPENLGTGLKLSAVSSIKSNVHVSDSLA